MNYISLLNELDNPDSTSFCGSASALFCYSLLSSLKVDGADKFLLLAQADAYLYMVQGKVYQINEKDESKIDESFSLFKECISILKSIHGSFCVNELLETNIKFLTDIYKLTIDTINNKLGRLYIYDTRIKIKDIVINDEHINCGECVKPLLIILRKLVLRKNNSKKPFTEGMKVDENISKIESAINDTDIVENTFLNNLSSFAKSCINEIKMQSLRDDYSYISKMLGILAKISKDR